MKNKHLNHQVNGNHYKDMAIEPMEFCLANMSSEELRGVLKFNSLRYIWRDKEDNLVDYEKAKHYIEIITEELSSRNNEEPAEQELFINFPTTRFAKINSPIEQVSHLVSEAREFISEIDNLSTEDISDEDMNSILDEATDFVHSYHTLSKISPRCVAESIERVVKKNMDRNYYS